MRNIVLLCVGQQDRIMLYSSSITSGRSTSAAVVLINWQASIPPLPFHLCLSTSAFTPLPLHLHLMTGMLPFAKLSSHAALCSLLVSRSLSLTLASAFLFT
jgi:hypothetical protein